MIIETIDAWNVPKSKPPFAIGLVKKSPKVAPNGLVKINAVQNKNILDTAVKKYAKTIKIKRLPIRIAPPENPKPESSARKSPSAVPNVFENKIAVQ